jgi:hypothetical protein
MGKRLPGIGWREQLFTVFEEMCDELYAWRKVHPDVSLDDSAAEVRPRRRRVIGELLSQLACQEGNDPSLEGVMCPCCGQRMVYKGDRPCTKEHLEGEITLKRAYYHCPAYQQAIFPGGHRLAGGIPADAQPVVVGLTLKTIAQSMSWPSILIRQAARRYDGPSRDCQW